MSARIVHFGEDDCKRLLILRAAGFAVEDCKSLSALRSALHKEGEIAAVVISEGSLRPSPEAIALIHARSQAPLVLFESMANSYDESQFDLIIPVLTHPREWLHRLNEKIIQGRAASSARAQSQNADPSPQDRPRPAEDSHPPLADRKRAVPALVDGLFPTGRRKA